MDRNKERNKKSFIIIINENNNNYYSKWNKIKKKTTESYSLENVE